MIAFLSVALAGSVSAAISAEGDCDTVKYKGGIPSYPGNLYSNFTTPSNCRAVSFSFPMGPRFYLQKYNYDTDTWSTVNGPISSPPYHFTGVNHGTYRLYGEVPKIFLSIGCGEQEAGPILIYNFGGQWVGYAGYWYGEDTEDYYSNSVIVGPTDQNDIDYYFIDIPETGAENAYDYGEEVVIDVSPSRNFNLWWLAIFEDGPVYNRYVSNGWTQGTPTSIDLSAIWGDANSWQFETWHSYTVQFAVENADCINSSWNNYDRTFFICPAGTGCRESRDPVVISVYPNPASDVIYLDIDDGGSNYTRIVTLYNLLGRQMLRQEVESNRINVAHMPDGIYSLVLTQDNRPEFVSRILIAH